MNVVSGANISGGGKSVILGDAGKEKSIVTWHKHSLIDINWTAE